MTEYPRLKKRFEDGDVVILNGDIGSELERLGVEVQDGFARAMATETHADAVRRVHESYMNAGAEVITANTSVAGREYLQTGGLGHKSDALNRRSVELALEARDSAGDRPVCIAGAISTYGVGRRTAGETVRADLARQAEVLAGAGADLLLLEVLGCDASTAAVAIEVLGRAGLPVWVALSCVAEEGRGEAPSAYKLDADIRGVGNGTRSFAGSAADLAQSGGDAYFVFHTLVEVAGEALRRLRDSVDVPVGVYPHCGGSSAPGEKTNDAISPAAFLRAAKSWVNYGAQIIGGCCGIGLDHIKLLRDGLPHKSR